MKNPGVALIAAVLVGGFAAGCSSSSSAESTNTVSSSAAASAGKQASQGSHAVSGKKLAAMAMKVALAEHSFRVVTSTPIGATVTKTPYDVEIVSDKLVRIKTTITLDGGVKIDVVGDGTQSYAKSSSFGTDKWFRVSARSKNPVVRGIAPGVDGILVMADPRTSTKLLTTGGNFTLQGQEKVNGFMTNRYVGKAPAAVFAKIMPSAAQLIHEDALIDAWIMDDGRVVKCIANVKAGGMAIPYTQEFSHYGKVKVSMPTSSQIAG